MNGIRAEEGHSSQKEWCMAQRVKQLGKQVAGHLGAGLTQLLGRRRVTGFGVLTYHRIAHPAGRGQPPTWNVPPRRFRVQLEGLLARGFHPVPLRRVLEDCAVGRPPRPGTFVLTFDDGYENVFLHAWPVLRRLGVPATVFLATAYLDTQAPFPFDDWAPAGGGRVAPSVWRPLSTAQCAQMYGSGLVDLGSHTHTHADFRGRPDQLAQDLLLSAAELRRRFGVSGATFSYPFGIAGPDLAQAARRTGMLCGLTTDNALVQPGTDPFAWGRFGVAAADTPATLAARLDGWYDLARNTWRSLRRAFQAAPPRPTGEIPA
jgi:peptidoglycan/xylan/chitin deacetylase (PgdA/CDA1 family)